MYAVTSNSKIANKACCLDKDSQETLPQAMKVWATRKMGEFHNDWQERGLVILASPNVKPGEGLSISIIHGGIRQGKRHPVPYQVRYNNARGEPIEAPINIPNVA